MVSMTDTARAELDNYFADKQKAPIRVYLNKGGCCGPSLTLALDERFLFPKDSSIKILTSGLLGEQYIGIEAGADDKNLAAGDAIGTTQSAVVLENLISQFLYSKAEEGPAKPAPAGNKK